MDLIRGNRCPAPACTHGADRITQIPARIVSFAMTTAWIAATTTLLCAGAGAESVLYNVRGYTPTGDGIREFGVLAFSDTGRMLATGDSIQDPAFSGLRRIDGQGRYVLPGLVDAHGHLYALGLVATTLDLAGIPSRDAALRALAECARTRPAGRWIQGRGWNQVLWPGKAFPAAADIDTVVADRPVWLRRVDGHAGWANSRALEAAGIDRDTLDPPGGRIFRDRNGDATGILIDKAMALVEAHIPRPGRAETRLAYETAIQRLLSLGITGVHDAGIDLDQAATLIDMAEDRIGADRIRGAYAWRRLLDSGAVVAGGSDFPVESPNPFLGLYAAVTRQDRDGRPEGGWYPDQAMTSAEALRSFTLAAAYAAHQEGRLGSLEAGKWADFIVVDRDFFGIPAAGIDDIRVLETWIGGRRLFRNGEGDRQ